jgi:hypothetical protein
MIQFKLSASVAHNLATDPKNKADKLSQTAITFIETWYKEKLYGRRKEFTSKTTDKGNIVEDESIEYAAKLLNWAAFKAVKNTERFENDFFKGIPDIWQVDMKNSYDCFSFPYFKSDTISKENFAQMQVYMDLTGLDFWQVVYTLMDMPEDMVKDEAWKDWKYKYKEKLEFTEVYEITKAKHTYSHLPDSLRIRVFDVHRDQDFIDKLKMRVGYANEYIGENLYKPEHDAIFQMYLNAA